MTIHIPSAAPFLAAPPRFAQLARWKPASGDASLHGEVFACASEGSGAALALALALDRIRSAPPDPAADSPDQRRWLWVQDVTALRLGGRPYRPGLPAPLRDRLVHVAAKTPEDALFALEEGLRCRELAFVIGELAGNPRALGFTASRRLSLMAERHGTPLWLVRLDARRDLGSARMRWEAHSAPSLQPHCNPVAPGLPSWRAELFRARTHPPGEWILRDDGNALSAESFGFAEHFGFADCTAPPDHGDLAGPIGDRSLAAG